MSLNAILATLKRYSCKLKDKTNSAQLSRCGNPLRCLVIFFKLINFVYVRLFVVVRFFELEICLVGIGWYTFQF